MGNTTPKGTARNSKQARGSEMLSSSRLQIKEPCSLLFCPLKAIRFHMILVPLNAPRIFPAAHTLFKSYSLGHPKCKHTKGSNEKKKKTQKIRLPQRGSNKETTRSRLAEDLVHFGNYFQVTESLSCFGSPPQIKSQIFHLVLLLMHNTYSPATTHLLSV